jgi:asparagine synthase (glutamine-hydrolysing)
VVEIFGVLDPAGPDPDRLYSQLDGAEEAGVRIKCHGPMAIGVVDQGDERRDAFESGSGLLVADVRVDARKTDGAWHPVRPGEDLDVLEAVLATDGPSGLANLAADFAVARFDKRSGSLLLSRDAFAMRPLFWARQGVRAAFATRPKVLIQLGFTTGELAAEPVANYLALRYYGGKQTAFQGVERVVGGRWVEIRADGTERRGRWFRPEGVREQEWSLADAATRLRSALEAAIASRARGRRVGISLSGGRDSGSVALAAATAGIRAVCITATFPPSDSCCEAQEAKTLAEGAGHRWVGFPAPARFTPQDVAEIPAAADSPLPPGAFALTLRVRDAAAEAGVRVMLDGEGGDDLFAGAPAVILDLLKAGRLRSAARAFRSFAEHDGHSYAVLAKRLLWAASPGERLGGIRGRRQKPPPWLGLPLEKPPVRGVMGSSRADVVRELLNWGDDPQPEQLNRLFRSRGMEVSSPFLDQRVVELALALPAQLRAPLPRPKPLLGYAFLGGLDASRSKRSLEPYSKRLGGSLARDFSALCPGMPEIVSRGFVKGPPEFDTLFLPEFGDAAMRAIGLEAWLRQQGDTQPAHREMPAERSSETMETEGWTYEPPVVEDLGSLEEITEKATGTGDTTTAGKKS